MKKSKDLMHEIRQDLNDIRILVNAGSYGNITRMLEELSEKAAVLAERIEKNGHKLDPEVHVVVTWDSSDDPDRPQVDLFDTEGDARCYLIYGNNDEEDEDEERPSRMTVSNDPDDHEDMTDCVMPALIVDHREVKDEFPVGKTSDKDYIEHLRIGEKFYVNGVEHTASCDPDYFINPEYDGVFIHDENGVSYYFVEAMQ